MGNIILMQDENSKENLKHTLVYLDGQFLSKLENKEHLKLKVQAGSHILKLKQGLVSSNSFNINIKDFEEIKVNVGTNYQPKTTITTALIPIVFFGGIIYNFYSLKSGLFLLILMLCTAFFLLFEGYKVKFKGLIYYMTIGRKNYFWIEEGKRS